MGNQSEAVLSEMIRKKYIPEEGVFEVTDKLCQTYFNIHRGMFSKTTGIKLRKTNVIFSKKLAGLSMMKLNKSRVENLTEVVITKKSRLNINSGFVYIITNESFPDKAKIGMTKDVKKRLSTYQTYDPYRRFEVKHYKFVENAKEVEKEILNKFSVDIDKGEWVSTLQVKELIEFLK